MKGNKQGLTGRQVEYFALGGALGSGIFLGVGQGIRIGGPALILAYAVAGIVMYIVARCLGEMALNGNRSGSFVSYTKRYWGPRAGFVHGWGYWVCGTMVCMAELTAVGMLVHSWMPSIPQWIPALGGLLVLCGINSLRVRVFGEVEFGMALIKILALSLFLIVGAYLLFAGPTASLPTATVKNLWTQGGFFPTGLHGFLSVLPIAAFAFGGTELICLAAAETVEPERTLPRAINGLLVRLLLFYVGTTFLIVTLVPWRDVPTDGSPIVAIFERMGVRAAGAIMSVVLITVLLSACNSLMFGMARVLRALALERCAPAPFGKLNRYDTPGNAVIVSMLAISAAIALNYYIPGEVFGLLMNSIAMAVVAVWAIFVAVHLRFRRSVKDIGALTYAAPLSPWGNLFVLVFLVAVTGILAMDATFRPAFIYVAGLFAGLFVFTLIRKPPPAVDTAGEPSTD